MGTSADMWKQFRKQSVVSHYSWPTPFPVDLSVSWNSCIFPLPGHSIINFKNIPSLPFIDPKANVGQILTLLGLESPVLIYVCMCQSEWVQHQISDELYCPSFCTHSIFSLAHNNTQFDLINWIIFFPQ